MDSHAWKKQRDDAYRKRLRELEQEFSFAGDFDVDLLFAQGKANYDRTVSKTFEDTDSVVVLLNDAVMAVKGDVCDIPEYDGKEIEGYAISPDGYVHLVIFGDEKIVTSEDGGVPVLPVIGGVKLTLARLQRELRLGPILGVKKCGEFFLHGSVHFVYITRAAAIGNVSDQVRWKPLNSVLKGDLRIAGLQFLMGLFPRLHLLNEHYLNLIDDDMIDEQIDNLKNFSNVQVVKALLADGPLKSRDLRGWMGILGRPFSARDLRRMIKKSASVIIRTRKEEVALNVKWLTDLYTCRTGRILDRHKGWGIQTMQQHTFVQSQKDSEVGGKMYSDECEGLFSPIFNHEPYPSPLAVFAVRQHPIVITKKGENGKRWLIGRVDTEIRRGCDHDSRCDEFCWHHSNGRNVTIWWGRSYLRREDMVFHRLEGTEKCGSMLVPYEVELRPSDSEEEKNEEESEGGG
jgi:hypothetical protein